jgi:hypothetical protein
MDSNKRNRSSIIFQKVNSDFREISSVRNSKSDDPKRNSGPSKGQNCKYDSKNQSIIKAEKVEDQSEQLEPFSSGSNSGKLAEYGRL